MPKTDGAGRGMEPTTSRPLRSTSWTQLLKSAEVSSSTYNFTALPADQMPPEQRKDYDLIVPERGEAPGPYKIFIQNPNLLQVLIPVGKYFQRSHSSLSDAEREIVVNLINAKWRAAYSNYEHEMIGERAGLPPEKVQALISGLHTSLDDPRQQVVYNHWNFLCSQPRPRSAATSGGMRGSKFRSDCDAPRNTARFSSRRIGDSF